MCTPETLDHLADLARVRLAITLMEGVRELQAQADQVLAILRFMERLEAQAIVQEAMAEAGTHKRGEEMAVHTAGH